MESTNGDTVVVGELLINFNQRREVVVQQDRGLHRSTSTSSIDDDVGMNIKNTNGHVKKADDKENLGKKSVYFDEDTDSTDEWSLSKKNNGDAESDAKQKISDINQDVLPSDKEISPESQEKEIKPEIRSAKGKTKRVKLENLIEESDEDEDVIELEFEREIKKLDAHEHDMYCPNCNTIITKVVLRKKRTKKGQSATHNTQQPDPVDVLGCLSCCSVFVPSGNCFSWIRLLANGGEDSEQTSQQTNVSASGLTRDCGNMVIDKEGDGFSLFRIFGNKPEKKSTHKPLQQSSSDSVGADGNTIIKQGNGHTQNVEGNSHTQNVEGNDHTVLNIHVDQIIVLPDQNGGASNQNEVAGVSSSNHQNGKYSEFPKPPLSTPPLDWKIDLGKEITNVSEENGIYAGEEPGASYGISNEPLGELSPKLTGIRDSKSVEIVKSIVYGGLMESITSLSIVSSAAASEATTMNIITIGLASLIGGLVIIGHNLGDLKNDQCEGASSKYQEQLGKKENFLLHATFAVLSFIVFGLIPPATYGFAFDKMNDKNYTLVAVAIASLLCIIILASGKAYINNSDKLTMYIKTIMYYICIAAMVSGISYEAGELIHKLMENFGWFETTPAFPLALPGLKSRTPVTWTSY